MIELSAGSDRARVEPEAGGRLTSLVAGGRERLVCAPAPGIELAGIGWGSFVMAPWVGRLRDGSLDWDGRSWSLPRNFRGHAIHGLGFDVPWSVASASEHALELRCPLDSGRWPFGGELVQWIELRPGRLDLVAEVVAGTSMPAAVGWHPWFRRSADEDVRVTVEARAVLETRPDLIPTGATKPVDAITDLRAGQAVEGRSLDDVYVGARSPAFVRWPDLELEIGFDAPIETIVVYTAPGAVCVEPQTAWPDAVHLAGSAGKEAGLVTLGPGERLRAHSWWEWRRPG